MKTMKWLTLAAVALSTTAVSASDLVVYSARKEHLIKPLFEAYTKKTGTQIKYITDKAGPLLARLKSEGKNTPADLYITVDAGNLWHAANEGVLAEVKSEALTKSVPAQYRDPGNQWFGLSVRARTIVYSTERVKPSELSTYEALAGKEFKGRLCLRTSKKVYNQSLVGTMIAQLGEEKAEQVVAGWVKNLAVPPFSNDTKTIQAIVAGQCDVAIVNTYYFGRLESKQPDIPVALYWPNQEGRGVHVNVSGAGVTKHSDNKAEAQKLIEWLASEEAQSMFAGLNKEYPVNAAVKPVPQVAAWGEFKGDTVNVSEAGRLQGKATMLMDKVGYK